MALKVGVLMGGWSPERKVSMMSGRNVVEGLGQAGVRAVPVVLTGADRKEGALKRKLKAVQADAFFVALHGGFGEDGSLQALLDKWRMPYTGSGALACGLAMHKGCSKLVFEANRVPTAPWHAIHRSTPPGKRLKEARIPLPVVVKPADTGSAIGVTIVRKKAGLARALKAALRYSPWALVEKFVPGVEVTATVLGQRALPVIEIVPKNEFYDFDAKYTPGRSDHLIPARIPKAAERKVKALAVKAGKALGCEGYYRVDFIVPKRGEPQILEVNTAPGMTSTSLVPDAARAAGIPFPRLLRMLVEAALSKSRKGA